MSDPTILVSNGVGTISGGGLIYTAGANGFCRANRPITGPCYWEVTPTNLGGSSAFTGIGSTSITMNALQSSAGAIHFDVSGNVGQAANVLGTIATWAINQRQDWAFDPINMLLWIRVAGGNWNNSGTADPATGVGGLAVPATFTPFGGMDPAFSAAAAGAAATFVFAAANFAGVLPTGFLSVDVCQITHANNVSAIYEVLPLVTKEFGPVAKAVMLPGDRYQYYWQPAGNMKFISGYTQENGVNVPNKRVDIYDRNTGELVATTTSDDTGHFILANVGRTRVRVVLSDPTTYNSIVFDNVAAV